MCPYSPLCLKRAYMNIRSFLTNFVRKLRTQLIIFDFLVLVAFFSSFVIKLRNFIFLQDSKVFEKDLEIDYRLILSVQISEIKRWIHNNTKFGPLELLFSVLILQMNTWLKPRKNFFFNYSNNYAIDNWNF